jgi:hypothetical protein
VSPLTPDQIIADYRRRKQEQYACPHHDKPLVCGECGDEIRLDGPRLAWVHGKFPHYRMHKARPAHLVDGVLVECTA